ncbi:MAG: 16S rRNA (guanine(527)-N(7))-methyltransferase RsmG [Thermodesulfobacteriota bacterium]
MEKEFAATLLAGCRALDLVAPDDGAQQRLYTYFTELKHWSRKVNLIAKGAGDAEILEKHFLDSLTLLPLLGSDHPHLLDIGTGAGFPGLVCGAARPELEVTLVEPRLKRAAFLRHLVRTLKLDNITVIQARVEEEEKLPSAIGFSHITSRAVSDIQIFLGMCQRFASPGLQVICMKGPKWKEELESWQATDSGEIFRFDYQREFELPQSKSMRYLLVFKSELSNYKKTVKQNKVKK